VALKRGETLQYEEKDAKHSATEEVALKRGETLQYEEGDAV
jgi:hypothetical protein